jgi:hypothetical protein
MRLRHPLRCLAAAACCAACAPTGADPAPAPGATLVRAFTVQDSSDRVAVVAGLDGPEAVRYDPDQDVYFVANWAGGGSERDADGFISRVSPEGEVERLRFMTGTADAPLHAPRGMFITADTLWAVDVDGVHGFDRRSGAHLAFVSFARFEPGFLNDVAAAPDGTLYITDTGRSRVYRLRGRDATLALEDSLLGPPNGVVWDAAGERFVFAPWGGEQVFRGWRPGEAELGGSGGGGGGLPPPPPPRLDRVSAGERRRPRADSHPRDRRRHRDRHAQGARRGPVCRAGPRRHLGAAPIAQKRGATHIIAHALNRRRRRPASRSTRGLPPPAVRRRPFARTPHPIPTLRRAAARDSR